MTKQDVVDWLIQQIVDEAHRGGHNWVNGDNYFWSEYNGRLRVYNSDTVNSTTYIVYLSNRANDFYKVWQHLSYDLGDKKAKIVKGLSLGYD
jgi:hypothetical protein